MPFHALKLEYLIILSKNIKWFYLTLKETFLEFNHTMI
jgi:hypothetical protein